MMRAGDLGFVALFRYTGLIWALVLGFAVFGHWPDPLTLFGAGIVAATGIFTLYRERRAARRAVCWRRFVCGAQRRARVCVRACVGSRGAHWRGGVQGRHSWQPRAMHRWGRGVGPARICGLTDVGILEPAAGVDRLAELE